MRKESFLLIFICYTLSGCSTFDLSWNPFYKPGNIAQPVVPATQEIEAHAEKNSYVDTGRVISPSFLEKGGTILVVPFRAGPGVESNERLDDLGLKIVQGIADELKDYRPYFKIITDEGKEEADIVLKGFFTEVGSDSRIKKWLPGADRKYMSLKGQLVQRTTAKPILIFTDSSETEEESKDYLSMSYELGQDIGQFIRSGTSE